jgi:hypothetical protein
MVSKYGAVRTDVDGITFASKAEARRYGELCILAQQGVISDLECQPRFPLSVNGVKIGTYVADFRYLDRERGVITTEDVKGVRTPVYRIKKQLVKALYGIEVQEVQS